MHENPEEKRYFHGIIQSWGFQSVYARAGDHLPRYKNPDHAQCNLWRSSYQIQLSSIEARAFTSFTCAIYLCVTKPSRSDPCTISIR